MGVVRGEVRDVLVFLAPPMKGGKWTDPTPHKKPPYSELRIVARGYASFH